MNDMSYIDNNAKNYGDALFMLAKELEEIDTVKNDFDTHKLQIKNTLLFCNHILFHHQLTNWFSLLKFEKQTM